MSDQYFWQTKFCKDYRAIDTKDYHVISNEPFFGEERSLAFYFTTNSRLTDQNDGYYLIIEPENPLIG